ncbi:MAG: DNA internalization-related competence protein ComEC/Rec2 [Gammaproteobacteria bacterium]
MHTFFLFFSLGAIFLQLLSSLPSVIPILSSSVIFGLAILLTYLIPCWRKYKKTRIIFLALFALSLGFSWALAYTNNLLDWQLPKNLEKQNITIECYIDSLPKYEAERLSFTCALEKLNGEKNKAKILLSWYQNYPSYPVLRVGDKWRLTVKLKRPHSTANPGSFDHEAYLLENRIRATGYVVTNKFSQNKLLNSHWYKYSIDRLRQYLSWRIKNSLPNSHFNAFISALTVGDQSGITQSDWQVLRRTGTIHFLIIAGLHIGFVAAFLFFIIRLLWRFFPRLCLIIPSPKAAAIFALAGAVFYSALAGFSTPTKRAIFMLIFFFLGKLTDRNFSVWSSFLVGLFIVTLINPLASLSSGFWLSFVAVFLILFSLESRLNNGTKFMRYSRLQWALTLGLIPLSLLLFEQASLISFFANLIAVPCLGFIAIPLSLSSSIILLINQKLGTLLLVLASKVFALIYFFLNWLANLPLSNFIHAVYNPWILLASSIGILLILAPRALPCRYLSLAFLSPLFFFIPKGPNYNEVWFTLLDVGQGLASVIRTQNHVIIYDTGPKFSPESDAGNSIVVPFLLTENLKNIDLMVVSHSDQDHSGGAKSILNNLKVSKLITSTPDFFSPFPAEHCYAGTHWNWDGVGFSFLHPPKDSNFSINNSSCVLKITSGKESILLDGDIEKIAEKKLVAQNASSLQSNILVAPHHGSISSSSLGFVQAVKPNYVLFPTGYLNRFKFPSPVVVMRYEAIGTKTLNSAETGAITFKFPTKSGILTPEIYRTNHRKFWY